MSAGLKRALNGEGSDRRSRLSAVARWIRDRGVTSFVDLFVGRAQPRKQEKTEERETAAEPDWWFARLSTSPRDARKLLHRSGCDGVFATSHKLTSAGGQKICWLTEGAGSPAHIHLADATAAAEKYQGRVLANARGLGVVVPADQARACCKTLHGDAVGLRGCPTFRVDLPLDWNPDCLPGERITTRKVKGPPGQSAIRSVFFRADEPAAPDTLTVQHGETTTTLAVVLADAPESPWVAAARKRQRVSKPAAANGAPSSSRPNAVPGSAVAAANSTEMEVDGPRRRTQPKSRNSRTDWLEARVEDLTAQVAQLAGLLKIYLPPGTDLPASVTAVTTRPPQMTPDEQLAAQVHEETMAAAAVTTAATSTAPPPTRKSNADRKVAADRVRHTRRDCGSQTPPAEEKRERDYERSKAAKDGSREGGANGDKGTRRVLSMGTGEAGTDARGKDGSDTEFN